MLFLRRLYNQNRKKIWITIAFIAFILILINAMNNILKNSKTNNNTNSSNALVTTIYDANYSVISEDKIEEKIAKETNSIIDNFIKYCNEGNTEKAYNLLTDDCKKELFPTLEIFTNNYYKNIFTTYKTYNIQLWINENNSYTYKVRILDDILATGKDNGGKALEDYFTVINLNGTYKLNINNYIRKEEINKENTTDNLSIKILNKYIYSDYEKYDIEITNNTGNIVLLDGFRDSKSIYLLDENESKYMALKNELTEEMFKIYDKNTFEKTIKFYKRTDQNLEIHSINFSDIILNYEEYKKDPTNYKDILLMNIKI